MIKGREGCLAIYVKHPSIENIIETKYLFNAKFAK